MLNSVGLTVSKNSHFVSKSGFTALFYAVDLAAPTILSALLRRGADPNTALKLSVRETPCCECTHFRHKLCSDMI